MDKRNPSLATDFARDLDQGEVWRSDRNHMAPGPLSTVDRRLLWGALAFVGTALLSALTLFR